MWCYLVQRDESPDDYFETFCSAADGSLIDWAWDFLFFAHVDQVLTRRFLSENKQYCKTWKLEGECVAFKDCQFTKNLGFISDEIVLEIKDRNSACSMFGKGLICCEKNAGEKNPVRGETPQQQLSITQHQSIPTTRFQAFTTTKPIRHTINQQQNRQPVDYQKHPNYRYLKNLKCGSSSISRISNGNWITHSFVRSVNSKCLLLQETTRSCLNSHGQLDSATCSLVKSIIDALARWYQVSGLLEVGWLGMRSWWHHITEESFDFRVSCFDCGSLLGWIVAVEFIVRLLPVNS